MNKTMMEEKVYLHWITEQIPEMIRPVLKGYIKHIQPFWLLRFTDYLISLMLSERLKIFLLQFLHFLEVK